MGKWDDVPPIHLRAVCPHCGRATGYDDKASNNYPNPNTKVECDECGKMFSLHRAEYIDVFELKLAADCIIKRMIAWTRTPPDQRPAWTMTDDEERQWRDYWRYCGRFVDGTHDRI